MTIGYYIGVYSSLGVLYLLGSWIMQLLASAGGPAEKGYLDVQFKLRTLEKCFIGSAILLIPFANYLIEQTNSYSHSHRLESANTMLGLYVVIALIWIIKLQTQINKIIRQNSDEA